MAPARFDRKIHGLYPEQKKGPEKGLEEFFRNTLGYAAGKLNGSPRRFQAIVDMVNALNSRLNNLADRSFAENARQLRVDLRRDGMTPDHVSHSFALIREAAGRYLGMRHFDVQLIGGWILLCGMVAEMETGEGKTLTATLPACTAALAGIPVHIITVNDYLAERDAAWMAPVYNALGLSVGVIRHGMNPVERRRAYGCDVTYCTNKEVVFDYLKDHLLLKEKPGRLALPLRRLSGEGKMLERLCLRGLPYAIVDEADSVLIDEARTPLIISGEGNNSFEETVYRKAMEVAGRLLSGIDFHLDEGKRSLDLTDEGRKHCADLFAGENAFWAAKRRREMLVHQALSALHLFRRDEDYLVNNGKVQIVDEFTGRLMSDRSWEKSLHQMVECKEGCQITSQKETLARISYQRFFRRYHWLAGMTGTAREVSRELWAVYGLPVVPVHPHRPLARKKLPGKVFVTTNEKYAHIVQRVKKMYTEGRPILVGTPTVSVSERLSELLTKEGLPHRVLNARQDKNEAEIVAQAGRKGQITVATNMAGRGTDIALGEGVRELGGLHVIATAPHGARRIDRQLFGRCGRQGDPGSFEGYASLEDAVLKPYATGCMGWGIRRLVTSRSVAGRFTAALCVDLAQWLLERKHFVMRRELLRFDESLENALAFSGSGE